MTGSRAGVLISRDLEQAINEQVGREFGASLQYVSIASYFDGDSDRVKELQQGVRQFRLRLQDYAPIPAQKRLLALATGDGRWANVRPPFLAMPEGEGQELLETLCREFGFEVPTG